MTQRTVIPRFCASGLLVWRIGLVVASAALVGRSTGGVETLVTAALLAWTVAGLVGVVLNYHVWRRGDGCDGMSVVVIAVYA